jgi:hypothetical protein
VTTVALLLFSSRSDLALSISSTASLIEVTIRTKTRAKTVLKGFNGLVYKNVAYVPISYNNSKKTIKYDVRRCAVDGSQT